MAVYTHGPATAPKLAPPPKTKKFSSRAKLEANGIHQQHTDLDARFAIVVNSVLPTVTPLHKHGDRNGCGSYRPMSLTSIRLKTLENALRDRIVDHLEANKLMMLEQHGF